MLIQINGEAREVEEQLSLTALVASLNLKPEQVAIELNRQVLRRGEWSSTFLRDGDQLEIVHFVGGGFVGRSQEAGARRQEQDARRRSRAGQASVLNKDN